MNMISTGTFQTEMNASNKQNDLVSKLVSAWEKKNAKVARAGGVSLMALSLAACGSDDDTATTDTAAADTTTVTPVTPVTPVVVASTTSTLTAGIDSVAGGAGDDIINAGLTSAGQQTLTALDSLKGGDGTDTMAVVMKSNATPASDSIEVYTVTATAASALSMLGSTGVTSVTNTGSSATLTVSNVALGTALTLGNTAQGGTFNFAAADVVGTADAATIDISSVTGGALTVGAGIEALTLNSVGSANTLGSLSSGATTLNISGAQNMTITGNATATTIDASSATGKITVTSDNTKAVSITTGSGVDAVTMTGTNTLTDTVSLGAGNDKVTFGAQLADADIVDGGDGTDTVVGISANLVALTSDATTSNLTNFETVQVSNQLAGALNVSSVQEDGIATVTLANSAGDLVDGTSRTITGEAGALTVNLGKSAAGNTGSIGSNGTLVLSDGANNATTTDALTINNTAVDSTTGKNLDLDDSITSTGYEVVTLNTGSGSGNTQQDIEVITITSDAASAATSLTLKGNNAIDIATRVTTNSTVGMTIDASALKSQASLTTSFDVASVVVGTGGTVTITGTGGDDIVGAAGAAATTVATTVTAGAGADAIYTGAGNDTITGGAGKDTINSGAGNDTVDAGAADDTIDFSGNFTIKDSVDGGDGTDTLILNNTDVTTVQAYSLGQVNTLNGQISNIEKVDFNSALNGTIDLGRLDSIANVVLDGLAGGSNVNGLAATHDITVTAALGQALGLSLADATGTADSGNITLKSSSAINMSGTVTTFNGIETINIAGIDATAAGTGNQNLLQLNADKLTTINLTGNEGLAITGTQAKVTLVDASALVANDTGDTVANLGVSFASSNTSTTAVVTLTGGVGEDTLTGRTGNTGKDIINGGAAADTLVVTTGADELSAGAGADLFNFTEALIEGNSVTSLTATYVGGTGTDIINILTATVDLVDADFRGITSIENISFLNANTGANTAVLAETADAAGISQIIGGAGAETITATDADFDNGLTLTMEEGADIVALNISNVASDTIVFSLLAGGIATDGDGFDGTDNDGVVNSTPDDQTESTASTAGAGDYYTGFDQGVDKVKFDGALETALEADGAAVRITSAGAFDFDTHGVIVIDNSVATVADFGDASALVTAFDTAMAGGSNISNGDEVILVINRTANLAEHGVFYFKDADGDGDVSTGDSLSLIGIIDLDAVGDMAATDFIV
jgi:S-layer protein